jgi:cytochrome b pre-mRNA-processing protein 3
MIFPLFRRRARPDTISTLYGTIVAQARLPVFYREYEVPDTVNGRFDLLVIHLVLVLGRLEADQRLRDVGQALFDRFCTDMDHNLREMGIGDLSVPRHMQRIGEAYYGRAKAYLAALVHEGQEELIEALQRNVYGNGACSRAAVTRLATYIREAVGDLREQPAASLLAGGLELPNPVSAVFVEVETSSTKD